MKKILLLLFILFYAFSIEAAHKHRASDIYGIFTSSQIPSLNMIEFSENDTQTCAANEFKVYADNSEQKLKACQDGVVSDLLGSSGDSIEVDGVAVVDPDLVSTGQIDVVDTSNTVSFNINDNSILEVDLKAVDSATDEECLTYESTTGDFEWQTCGGASGITVNTTTITGGTNTRVPFNDSGVYQEDAGLTFNKTTDSLFLTGAAPEFNLDDSDLTIDASGDGTYFNLTPWSATGGVRVNTYSDTDVSSFVAISIIGSNTPTAPVFDFRGSKWNGSSVALAATEPLFAFRNSSTQIYSGDGSGNFLIRSADGPSYSLADSDLTMPFAAAPSGRFLNASYISTTAGGASYSGSSDENATAVLLDAWIGSSTPSIAAIKFNVRAWNGATGFESLISTEPHTTFTNNGVEIASLRGDGQLKAFKYESTGNCSDSAGDSACSSHPAGSVVIDAADTTTVVSTTAVTANSQIFLQIDASLGARLSVTCNTQAASVFNLRVTARTAATSFTITVDAGPTTNPLCISYFIVN